MTWPLRTLDELGYVGRGRSSHRPRNDPSLYGGEYPFIQTADIQAAHVKIRGYSQTYNGTGLAQSKLWDKPTLCMTIAGENTAATAILTFPACFPDSIVGFVPDPKKADIRYVKHALDLMRHRFRSVSKGATQDNLPLAKLLTFPLPIPSLSTQKRIASIIAAYDDLIEINLQRIALLEGAARMLYREWFVHFRFPGHEHVRIIDGLPEGWERKSIGDACSFLGRGISPTYDDDGEYVVVSQKCIRDRLFSIAPARRQSKEYKAEKALKYLDVLINSTGTGTLGRVAQCWFEPEATTFDSHVTVARSNDIVDPFWFGYALLELQPVFEEMGEGATNQKELSKNRIAELRIISPSSSLQLLFADLAANTTAQIQTLINQNEKLAQARDLLLPRLMNGEIAV